MLTDINAKDYITNLEKFYQGKPEVDLILMAMFFRIDLQFLYVENEAMKEISFSFGKEKAQVYINPEGYFDVVYEKGFVRNCGLCQSIILDVVF